MLAPALAPLAAWPQFICYRLVPKPDGKTDKLPMCPRGGMASTTDPTTWGTHHEAFTAWQAAPSEFHGIGFVFTERDPFYFLDIDGAYSPAAGWSLLAQELLGQMSGAAVEVSSSGTGLHIIGSYRAIPAHRCKNKHLHLELYHTERFVALTGTHASGFADAINDAALAALVARYFEPSAVDGAPVEWTTEPHPDWSGPEDDAELIALAIHRDTKSAAAAFGGTTGPATFTELWTADVDALSRRYPAQRPGAPYDGSSVDQAMANQLAFWTGRHCDRMERIMRMSALARDKWDAPGHASYLENTILKACAFTRNIYNRGHGKPEPAAPAIAQELPSAEQVAAAGMTPRGASPIMLSAAQVDHFAGCIYVTSLNKVLMPNGDRLDQARFDVVLGGYEFVMDPHGKKTTSGAWEAFTRSQVFAPPIADRLCFRPELGSGSIVVEAGRRLANYYVERPTEATPGDASPFLEHLARMLPDARDRQILTTYMGSVVRNPGMKAQWWPVIQGGEGNGKSLMLLIMQYAIGESYSHLPNTDKMIRNGMNFNGWIDGKLFLGLEEVYAANRRDFFEGFKTTVTNRSIPVEAKGIEEVTLDNRANGIITTNHKEGVPVTSGNRRYAVFFTAQQSKEESLAAGLTDAYFAKLMSWFWGTGDYAEHGPNYGFRVVNHYLRTMPLAAEFDPAQLAIWAPETSSTAEAIQSSLGKAEQEIQEAIEEDRCGFAGGWVSSFYLGKLLETIRVNVPPRRRRELMTALGYDIHPALAATGGRVNNVIQPDNSKPRLYVRTGSIAALNLKTPSDAAKAYTEAQTRAISGAVSPAANAFK